MSSYIITGASRGLGWEFLRQLSNDPTNLVIGLVRNKELVENKVADELNGRTDIKVLKADMSNFDKMKVAAGEVATITGGKLDYITANAAYIVAVDGHEDIAALGMQPQQLSAEFRKLMDTNVLGNIHLYNLLMPLILRGQAKKVVAISSGLGDIEWTNDLEIELLSMYSMSKAAMNMATAKFNARYKRDGVLFLSICPGLSDVQHYDEKRMTSPTPDQQIQLDKMFASFIKFSPTFNGPDPVHKTVDSVLWVVNNSSLAQGDGGRFLSRTKDNQWL